MKWSYLFPIALSLISTLVFGEVPSTPTLPKLYQLPNFKLKDQDGKALDREALSGKILVTDFIFTSCGDECPLMTSKLKSAQDHLKDTSGVLFVSISTDPKGDTPKVLKSYAKRHKVDEKNWRFLTGDKKVIVELANKGFKFPAAENSISHSQKFAVVDGAGWVRGYYDSNAPADLKQMESDIRRLVTEK